MDNMSFLTVLYPQLLTNITDENLELHLPGRRSLGMPVIINIRIGKNNRIPSYVNEKLLLKFNYWTNAELSCLAIRG